MIMSFATPVTHVNGIEAPEKVTVNGRSKRDGSVIVPLIYPEAAIPIRLFSGRVFG